MSLSPCPLPSRQKDIRKRISFLWDRYGSGYPKAGEWSRSCSWRRQHLKSEGDETGGMRTFQPEGTAKWDTRETDDPRGGEGSPPHINVCYSLIARLSL